MIDSTQKKLERYQKVDKIGEGTYGKVYKAVDNWSKEIVALKKIRLENENQGIPATSLREISALRELEHPNIVNLKDLICGDHRLYLIFEFITQDLRKFLKKDSVLLSSKEIKFYIFQILQAIVHCHSCGIIHRDLKPHNILISENGLIKIADFGLARTFITPCRTYTHEVVTLWYRAPEILLGTSVYTPAIDMWSVGCIFGELFTKKPLFTGDSEIHQLFKIFQILGTPNEGNWQGVTSLPDYKTTFPQWKPQHLSTLIPNLDPLAFDLLEKMLTYNPNYRITAFEALNHPYFADLHSQLPKQGQEF